MIHYSYRINGDHIISSLKALGFKESTKPMPGNLINFVTDEHNISVSRGSLDVNETARLRAELVPIFKTYNIRVKASGDKILLNVKDWLDCSGPSCRK
jgi:hypothetical protein